MTLAILSQFSSPADGTNRPFCVDLNNQSINIDIVLISLYE